MEGTAAALIERYGMKRLPVEGVFLAQTWRGAKDAAGVPAGTAVVGLLCDDPPSSSRFHRLGADEVWHAYAGDSFRLVLLHPDGSDEEIVLGPGLPQHVVPAGTWQAATLAAGGSWALFGCTMAPGFTPEAFEGGTLRELLAAYPGRERDIRSLGVPDGAPTHLAD